MKHRVGNADMTVTSFDSFFVFASHRPNRSDSAPLSLLEKLAFVAPYIQVREMPPWVLGIYLRSRTRQGPVLMLTYTLLVLVGRCHLGWLEIGVSDKGQPLEPKHTAAPQWDEQ